VTFVEAAGGHSGTLTLSSGGVSESLTLLGAYATSNFRLSSDTHGGTLLTWVASGGFAASPPAVGQMVTAMAAFTGAGGTSLNTAATSAAHAPLLVAGH
jgi:acyl-CoA hydrolase